MCAAGGPGGRYSIPPNQNSTVTLLRLFLKHMTTTKYFTDRISTNDKTFETISNSCKPNSK